MKIAIGFKLQEGPWGGGNQFARSLVSFLELNNIEVVFSLEDDDIDLILLTDPRAYLSSNAFDTLGIYKYFKKNHNVVVAHRINECDERKNTKNVNKQLALANSICDHTVYIASWLIDNFKDQDLRFTENHSVILNGADERIFKNYNNKLNNKKIKIVTHHWGGSYHKGWDIYIYLDRLLSNKEYTNIQFHYIGKTLKGYNPQNMIIHEPLSGEELGKELSKYDIYLTASENEPAGMHHIEGAMCGLPLLYKNSGALPEYCSDFGIMFNKQGDFQEALDKILQSYKSFNMENYPNTSRLMNKQYFLLFNKLIEDKKNIFHNYSFFKYLKLSLLIIKFKILNRMGIM